MVKDLAFVSPESVGIKSENVLEFIRLLEYHKINFHSLMIVKDGKIITEGYIKPFNENHKHRIYSSSKTVVALAMGLLVTQGKVKVTDSIVDYLGKYVDSELHPWKKQTTIEDCLKMALGSVGNNNPPKNPNDWIYNVINDSKFYQPSGTIFNYSSGAEISAAIIKEVTGKEFLDYLRPVFDKIGVSTDIWCVKNAENISWGGSGVIITLRDFAKIGELVLNKGEYNGEQLIDREYMEKLTSKQINNFIANNYTPLRSGGYGYLTWITDNATCFRGMGLQQCYCFHDKNLMLVTQGDTQSGFDTHDNVLYDLFKYFIYDKVGTPTADGKAYIELKEKLKNLTPPTYGLAHVPFEKQLNGKTYAVYGDNNMKWKYFRFDFSGDEGTFTYENARGKKQIKFGLGKNVYGTFPETHYYDVKRDEPSNREQECYAVAEWMEDKKIMLRVYMIDSNLGNAFMQFGFKEDKVGISINTKAEFFFEDYVGAAWGELVKD